MSFWDRLGIGSKAGHDATAFNCMYYTGDRAGYDLNAVCYTCEEN